MRYAVTRELDNRAAQAAAAKSNGKTKKKQ
jgi:hypothetical protein